MAYIMRFEICGRTAIRNVMCSTRSLPTSGPGSETSEEQLKGCGVTWIYYYYYFIFAALFNYTLVETTCLNRLSNENKIEKLSSLHLRNLPRHHSGSYDWIKGEWLFHVP